MSSTNPSLVNDTQGLSTVEYLILLVVIGVASISVWKRIGASIKDKAQYSSDQLNGLGGEAEESSDTPSGIQERADAFEDSFGN